MAFHASGTEGESNESQLWRQALVAVVTSARELTSRVGLLVSLVIGILAAGSAGIRLI